MTDHQRAPKFKLLQIIYCFSAGRGETADKETNHFIMIYSSVSQPPGRGPVPVPDINYTGPREVLLEVVISVF